MKEIKYEMKVLSSLILSPRSGRALYKDIDEFKASAEVSNNKKKEVSCIYPFYQYGEYKSYHPKDAEYYIPGSSVKGALLSANDKKVCMVDDVEVKNTDIVLRSLYKAQYIHDTDQENAAFSVFFENVGVEMIKAGARLNGSLYLEDNVKFSQILKSANEATRNKMGQMRIYLQSLLNSHDKNEKFSDKLRKIEQKLSRVLHYDNVILLGGYKGLCHSMVLKTKEKKDFGGIYIDDEKNLPHGIVQFIYKEQH